MGVDLKKANLIMSNLKGANLREAELSGAFLKRARNLTIEQLSKVETLYDTSLDTDLKKEIEDKYPHLLEKPKDEE